MLTMPHFLDPGSLCFVNHVACECLHTSASTCFWVTSMSVFQPNRIAPPTSHKFWSWIDQQKKRIQWEANSIAPIFSEIHMVRDTYIYILDMLHHPHAFALWMFIFSLCHHASDWKVGWHRILPMMSRWGRGRKATNLISSTSNASTNTIY